MTISSQQKLIFFHYHCHYVILQEDHPRYLSRKHLKWASSREFVSSSIPSWQILTAHAQSFRGARDLAFCLKVPLDSLLVWASRGGSCETGRMRRLAWTIAARIGDKYQICLKRPKWASLQENLSSGFATRVDSNRPAQLMRLARLLKFRL